MHAPRAAARPTRCRATRWSPSHWRGKRGQVTELATGRDFYASPRLSPDGKRLAFLAWDLPDMPWDSAALYVARRPRRRHAGPAQAHRRRRRQRRLPAGVGTGRPPLLHLGQDRLGPVSIAGTASAIARVHGAAAPSCGGRSGCSARAAMRCTPTGSFAAVSSEHGMPLSGDRHARRAARHVAHARLQQQRRAHRRSRRRRRRLRRARQPAARDAGRHAASAAAACSRSPDAPPTVIDAGFVSRGEVRRVHATPSGETVYGIHYPPANAASPRTQGRRCRRRWCWRTAGPPA